MRKEKLSGVKSTNKTSVDEYISKYPARSRRLEDL